MSALASATGVIRNLLGQRRSDIGSRSGRSYAITLLTPVRAGQESALRDDIAALGIGEDSPLSRLPSVHFARWLLIERLRTDWPGAPVPPPRLRSAYLLFTANVTAPDDDWSARMPHSFLTELRTRIGPDADTLWGHCLGYPGRGDADAFGRYLAASQVETSLFHVGYPDVTVDQVRARLAARDSLIAFCLEHQDDPDDAAVHRAYLEESSTWFP